jgi:hypothetical protein
MWRRRHRTRQGAAERFCRAAPAVASSELAIRFEPPDQHMVEEPHGSDDQVRIAHGLPPGLKQVTAALHCVDTISSIR